MPKSDEEKSITVTQSSGQPGIYEPVPGVRGGRILHDVLNIDPARSGSLWRHVYLGPTYSRHYHEELEMNLAHRGSAVYLAGQRRYRMTPGSMVWLFPAQDHILIDQSPDFRCWILVARPSLARNLASRGDSYATLSGSDPHGSFARKLAQGDFDRVMALLDTVETWADDAACFNVGLAYAVAASWLAFLRSPDHESTGLHPAVERAVQQLRNEADAGTVAVLAREAGSSVSRLSRLFHAQVGMTIAEFRNAQRLERFSRIRETQRSLNLAAAAFDAGFGSYAQFYRVYREAYGRGPGGG